MPQRRLKPPGHPLRPDLRNEPASKRDLYRNIPHFQPPIPTPRALRRWSRRDPALRILDNLKRNIHAAIARALNTARMGMGYRPRTDAPVGQRLDEHWHHEYIYVNDCALCWRRENARAHRLARYFGYDVLPGDGWEDYNRDMNNQRPLKKNRNRTR